MKPFGKNAPSKSVISGREILNQPKILLQAASPDEIALVKYANSIGMQLI